MKPLSGDPRLLNAFIERHGDVWSLDEYFDKIFDTVENALNQYGIALYGMSMKLKKVELMYGETVCTSDYLSLRKDPEFNDFNKEGWHGELFWRTSAKVPWAVGINHIFRTALLHVGSGGTDFSHQSPWSEVQKSAYSNNSIMPTNLQYPVHVYKHNCHFYTADFPKLGSMDMLAKLGDTEIDRWSKKYETGHCAALDMDYALSVGGGLPEYLEHRTRNGETTDVPSS